MCCDIDLCFVITSTCPRIGTDSISSLSFEESMQYFVDSRRLLPVRWWRAWKRRN